MKKIIIAMAAIAAVLTIACCNKEQPVSPKKKPSTGINVITASIENNLTKTSLNGNDTDGYKVFWSEGDKVFVTDYCFEDWAAEYTLDKLSVDSPQGNFEWHDGDYFFPFSNEYSEPVFEQGIEYFAIYPSDFIKFDNAESAPSLTWRMDQLYGAANLYVPMVTDPVESDGVDPEFEFKNLGGLLRLRVKGKATIRAIRISAAEAISGAVHGLADIGDGLTAVMEDGAPFTSRHITLDCGEGGVALTDAGTDFYISMPAFHYTDKQGLITDGYSDVTITLTDMKGNICVKKLSGRKLVIERSKITPASFTASDFRPKSALPGKFSVAEGKQVHFSPGNLFWDGDNESFKFESNQYDAPNLWDTSHMGLFYWSKDASVACAAAYSDAGASDSDIFFTNDAETTPKSGFTVNGETGKYRTLSSAEWAYLFNSRINASDLYRYGATVCNKNNCIILAPDGFIGTIESSYDASTWPAAEAEGLVCLPAAGYRDNISVRYYGSKGYYWSSSAAGSRSAYYMGFPGRNVLELNAGDFRYFGDAVRLVTDCE